MDPLDAWLTRYELGQIDRRAFLTAVSALAASAAPHAQSRPGVVAPSGIHHVEIKTTDLARSTAFYTKLLGPGQQRDERTIIPLGAGGSRGYLSIARGPIPRVDHLAAKVSTMSGRDPGATLAAVAAAGFKARQSGTSIFVMDPDNFEVELIAASAPL